MVEYNNRVVFELKEVFEQGFMHENTIIHYCDLQFARRFYALMSWAEGLYENPENFSGIFFEYLLDVLPALVDTVEYNATKNLNKIKEEIDFEGFIKEIEKADGRKLKRIASQLLDEANELITEYESLEKRGLVEGWFSQHFFMIRDEVEVSLDVCLKKYSRLESKRDSLKMVRIGVALMRQALTDYKKYLKDVLNVDLSE
ncbi:hypothetical protein [Thermococcus sp. GR6]|uniref:hypothetical protein n=1 Tax=Thermococcus sp. GR6 TaxID=1638256 RepID=UPI0014303854|nr:hypothetical protein [Thermococcus sp. GR6]NJE41848.1 hypothetical protein [Thermococcus sp. GR6]